MAVSLGFSLAALGLVFDLPSTMQPETRALIAVG
jgi:hypothetical protein